MRRIVSLMILSLLLVGTFTLAFNVGLVHAQAETVYINSDGSVSPSDAPISSLDNVTYTLTGNMSYLTYEGIVVERNNIVIDGNGYTVQGRGSEYGSIYATYGIGLTGVSNVTIKNTNVDAFGCGINATSSNYITFTGNNVSDNDAGIGLFTSSNDTVSGNTVRNNVWGIYLIASSNVSIFGNNVTINDNGIFFVRSSNDTVSGNNVTGNGLGIQLDLCNCTSISGNNESDNDNGIDLWNFSSNDTVSGNNATADDRSIVLSGCSDNSVSFNDITASHNPGITLDGADDNILNDNTVTNCFWYGMYIQDSLNNTVVGNNVTANSVYGIYLVDSSNNLMYHNGFVGNGVQAAVFYLNPSEPANTWDNGYPSGGNYWSDYNGTDLYSGHYQNVTGSDGIGDTPYIIGTNDIDHYPLMNPYSTNSLSVTVSPSSANLDVDQSQTFNSTVSGGTFPYTYQWCLNGTAVSDADLSSWTFTPTSAGSYTIYANVTDSSGEQAASNTANVTVNSVVHDVALTNMTVPMSEAYQGWVVNVNVTVANLGSATESFSVTLSYNGTSIATLPIANMAPNSTQTLVFDWNTTNVLCGNYTIQAETLLAQEETNVANNVLVDGTLRINLMGDVNGEGKVDMTDVMTLVSAFGSYPGHPRWNPACDLNQDGRIDLADIVLALMNFGKTS